MSQIYKCPHCKQALSVTDDLLDTEVECPSCQNVITLSAAPIPVAAVAKPVRPVAQTAPQAPVITTAGSPSAGKPKGVNGLIIALVAGALVLAVGGIGVVGVVAYVMTQRKPAEPPPPPDPREKEEKLLREQIAEAEKKEAELAVEAGKLTASVEALRTDLKQHAAEVDALTTERNSLTGDLP